MALHRHERGERRFAGPATDHDDVELLRPHFPFGTHTRLPRLCGSSTTCVLIHSVLFRKARDPETPTAEASISAVHSQAANRGDVISAKLPNTFMVTSSAPF